MGRTESLHGCLESSLKSTEACHSGGGKDEEAGKNEWHLLGHASLSPSVWEKHGWSKVGRNDHFKLLQKLGVGGNKVTIGSSGYRLELGE